MIVERPQHMLMRVAVGIHGSAIDDAIETYNLLSEKWFTHATPTLFNAGNKNCHTRDFEQLDFGNIFRNNEGTNGIMLLIDYGR